MTGTLKPIESYICGNWYFGNGNAAKIKDSFTGETFCRVNSDGINFKDVLEYGRTVGRQKLSVMTFPQRGLMLKKLAMYLLKHKETFYELSFRSGATRTDSWIDIEGGIGNLFGYASLRRNFTDTPFMVEDKEIVLSRDQSFSGRHLLIPKPGVVLHINAFNFPVWGMLEKIAVNLLAGVPAVVKPATSSCYLTECVVRAIITSGILPEGSLQLICGSVGDIFDHLMFQDVVTFTGSFSTGLKLKSHPNILSSSIPFNMEADSLNCSILCDDVEPGDPEFDLFIREVVREITVKCGQKCTAIRRILVLRKHAAALISTLKNKLSGIQAGNPRTDKARMGALISHEQVNDVLEKTGQLKQDAELVMGCVDGIDPGGAALLNPILLYNPTPSTQSKANDIEAFGPVSTIMAYDSIEEAIFLANQGKGSLCSSVVTADPAKARQIILGCGGYHGRMLIINRENQKSSTGHGSPLPMLIHGGPGRAGGGEEMGGMLGIKHYMQRTAIQASPTFLSSITDSYHTGGKMTADVRHPFRKFFEELEIGETLFTHKRTFSAADISNFSNLSWDHFYAHTDATSLADTIFEKPVVHGYMVLSAAAGLFVDPAKGNVLLNYGLEDCRFIQPVYAGDTIGVKLTVKEKTPREQKEGDLYPQGIVKFLVQVENQRKEIVAVATILTLVRAQTELL